MINFKGHIFDLDGTLIDSMWVWNQIDIDFLSQKGLEVPDDLHEEITHLSFKQTAEYFKNRFNLNDCIEDIMKYWNDMAHDYYSNKVTLKPGVFDYLNKLKNEGCKIALATSNSLPLLEAVLKENNIYHLFDAITITDEVKKSKDNPDIYLLSAQKLNLAPHECMVYEDILAAIKGAKSANMQVTAIYDKAAINQLDAIKSHSDFYITDYTELI